MPCGADPLCLLNNVSGMTTAKRRAVQKRNGRQLSQTGFWLCWPNEEGDRIITVAEEQGGRGVWWGLFCGLEGYLNLTCSAESGCNPFILVPRVLMLLHFHLDGFIAALIRGPKESCTCTCMWCRLVKCIFTQSSPFAPLSSFFDWLWKDKIPSSYLQKLLFWAEALL